MGLIRPKKELKCLDTLGKQFEIIEFFFYRKLIPLMTLPSIGVTILKVNCFFFSHGTTNSRGVMIGYLGSKKLKLIE